MTGNHRLFDRGMNLLSPQAVAAVSLMALQGLLAYEWGKGGVEKLTNPQFVGNMKATLERFAAGNPHDWYVAFLQTLMDRAMVFAWIVEWGEILVALGLVISILLVAFGKSPSLRQSGRVLAVLALFGGMFMNANFYFASGWMSPSSSGLNMMMFWVQAIVLYCQWALFSQSRSS